MVDGLRFSGMILTWPGRVVFALVFDLERISHSFVFVFSYFEYCVPVGDYDVLVNFVNVQSIPSNMSSNQRQYTAK
jgi:hypothetical protein